MKTQVQKLLRKTELESMRYTKISQSCFLSETSQEKLTKILYMYVSTLICKVNIETTVGLLT